MFRFTFIRKVACACLPFQQKNYDDFRSKECLHNVRTAYLFTYTLMGTTMDTGWRKKMPPCQKLPPSFMNFRSDPLTRAKKKKNSLERNIKLGREKFDIDKSICN